MNDNPLRDLFEELRDEPLPADSLARVRIAVSARTAQPARVPFAFPWRIAAAALTALALIGMLIWKPAPAPPPIVAKEEARPRPAPPAVIQTVQPPFEPRQARIPKRKQTIDSLIRLETPDPNVVIFLVAGGAGE